MTVRYHWLSNVVTIASALSGLAVIIPLLMELKLWFLSILVLLAVPVGLNVTYFTVSAGKIVIRPIQRHRKETVLFGPSDTLVVRENSVFVDHGTAS